MEPTTNGTHSANDTYTTAGPAGHGGARRGAGRKPNAEREPRPRRYEAFSQEMERMMIEALPEMMKVQIQKGMAGDIAALRFFSDRILGRPATNGEPPMTGRAAIFGAEPDDADNESDTEPEDEEEDEDVQIERIAIDLAGQDQEARDSYIAQIRQAAEEDGNLNAVEAPLARLQQRLDELLRA